MKTPKKDPKIQEFPEIQELLKQKESVINKIEIIKRNIINDLNIDFNIKDLKINKKRLSLINEKLIHEQVFKYGIEYMVYKDLGIKKPRTMKKLFESIIIGISNLYAVTRHAYYKNRERRKRHKLENY